MTMRDLIPSSLKRWIKTRLLPRFFRWQRRLRGQVPQVPAARVYTCPDAACFVGYYDVTPVSPDGTSVLGHCVRDGEGSRQAADVGYFDLASGLFVSVDQTALWCWQLGARLQWWPGEPRRLAYNTVHNGQPVFAARAENGLLDVLCEAPVFDVNAAAGLAINLNFGRLAWARPGYGYPALEDPFRDLGLPEEDGLWISDLRSGRRELRYPLTRFADLVGAHTEGAFHYLNAASLSPTARKFHVLYKRIPDPAKPDIWDVDAVVGSVDGSEIRRVPLPGKASHYWWLNDAEIVYTSVRGKTCDYLVYDWQSNRTRLLHPRAPDTDGHPSHHAPSSQWVTDTYPDRFGEQALYILAPDGRRDLLGQFPANPAYQDDMRCDLHPRWSPDGRSVVIDTTAHGRREIWVVDIERERL